MFLRGFKMNNFSCIIKIANGGEQTGSGKSGKSNRRIKESRIYLTDRRICRENINQLAL